MILELTTNKIKDCNEILKMKAAFVIFLCGLIAVANTLPVEGPEAGNTGLSRAQVEALLKVVIPPWVTCINSNCRLGCVGQGHVAGYCAAGQCQCVPAPV